MLTGADEHRAAARRVHRATVGVARGPRLRAAATAAVAAKNPKATVTAVTTRRGTRDGAATVAALG